MNKLSNDLSFSMESGITLQQIEKMTSLGFELRFLLVQRITYGDWTIKVYSRGFPTVTTAYLFTARGSLKIYSSLDTAVNQLAAIAPNCSISVLPIFKKG